AVRLLADGAVSAGNGTAPDGDVPTESSAPSAEAELPFESGDLPNAEGSNSDNNADNSDWSFDDVARTSKSSSPDDDDARPQLEAHEVTLREHLLEQVSVTVREPRDRALLELIIDALNDNGYLEESL